MIIKGRVSVASRIYKKQNTDTVLSYGDYEDSILYTINIEVDDNLVGHDGMTFQQIVLYHLNKDWSSIIPDLIKLHPTDIAMLQVMVKGKSYVIPLPKTYYKQSGNSNPFSRAFKAMTGNSESKLKVPTVTEECTVELNLNTLGYFLFRIGCYDNPDIISDIESGKLDYCGFSDNMKSEVVTKAWLEYLNAIIRSRKDVPIYTVMIPKELVDVSAKFCLNRGYDRITYMFLQEHPCRLSEHMMNELIRWHNSNQQ